MIRATLLCGLTVAGVSAILLVPTGVRVEEGRRVLKSPSGYQTVSMLDGGRTGLYYDVGEEAGQLRPQAQRVVLLGMGGGEMLRAVRRSLPRAELVGVEVNATVAGKAISDFHVLDFGVQVVVDDAFSYIAATSHPVDILMVDVFDDATIPRRFLDPAFFRACRDALAPGGLFLMNVYPAVLSGDVALRLYQAGFSKVSKRGLMEGNVLVFAEP